MPRHTILDRRAEVLAGEHDPAEVLDAVLAVDELTADHEAALLYAISFWVVQVTGRAEDEGTLSMLDRLCSLASSRAVDSSGNFAVSLKAFRSVLEHKRQAIVGNQSGRVGKLMSAERILEELRQRGPLTQAELSRSLDLTPGRVSQVLSVMEEARMIQRVRRGRENVVSIVMTSSQPSISAAGSLQREPQIRPLMAFQQLAA